MGGLERGKQILHTTHLNLCFPSLLAFFVFQSNLNQMETQMDLDQFSILPPTPVGALTEKFNAVRFGVTPSPMNIVPASPMTVPPSPMAIPPSPAMYVPPSPATVDPVTIEVVQSTPTVKPDPDPVPEEVSAPVRVKDEPPATPDASPKIIHRPLPCYVTPIHPDLTNFFIPQSQLNGLSSSVSLLNNGPFGYSSIKSLSKREAKKNSTLMGQNRSSDKRKKNGVRCSVEVPGVKFGVWKFCSLFMWDMWGSITWLLDVQSSDCRRVGTENMGYPVNLPLDLLAGSFNSVDY